MGHVFSSRSHLLPMPCFLHAKKGKEEILHQCLSEFKIKITEFINACMFTLLLPEGRKDCRITFGLKSSPQLHPGFNIHQNAQASKGQGLVPELDIISCVMST